MRRRAGTEDGGDARLRAAHPEKLRRARMFRQAPTSAEAMVWEVLRRRFVAGLRFRRQHIIAGYVVDFYCPALRLAIEIDGGIHDTQQERDELRTHHLAQLGTQVLRIPNALVFSDLTTVVAQILETATQRRAALNLNR